VVQEILGWSSQRMAERYVHVDEVMGRDAADALAGLIFPAAAPIPSGPITPGSATVLLPEEGAKIIPFRRRSA
jgi:hypothetical protein